jgi:ABC-type spermidine/putrescine transport system permease subunit I
MEKKMPLDSMLVAAAVVLMFVCFAVPVAWAVNRTSRKA